MLRRWLPALLVALGLGGCSATGVLASLTASPRILATRDVAFGPGLRDRLDVYRPRAGGLRPVVVFFYGGGWEDGSRKQYRFVGQSLAAEGYLVIVPDYRLYPEVRYPDFLKDCARAVRWAKDHAADYGGDPSRLFLMGHSAGAYNAAMLTLDERLLAAVGMNPKRDVRGMVGLAGPYDFLPLQSPTLKIIFGPEKDRPATQPIAYVDADEPPLLLMHGRTDKVVDPGNAERLAARVRQKGGRVELVMFPKLSHALIVGSLAKPLRGFAPTMAETKAFIDREAAR
jgi:acetyl esterase/lipase